MPALIGTDALPLKVNVSARLPGREVAVAVAPTGTGLDHRVVLLDGSIGERQKLVVPCERTRLCVEKDHIVASPITLRIVLGARALPRDFILEPHRSEDRIKNQL